MWSLGTLAIFLLAATGLVFVFGAIRLRQFFRTPTRQGADGRGSIMECDRDRMTIQSADNVRLLSEAQIRILEREGEDEA